MVLHPNGRYHPIDVTIRFDQTLHWSMYQLVTGWFHIRWTAPDIVQRLDISFLLHPRVPIVRKQVMHRLEWYLKILNAQNPIQS